MKPCSVGCPNMGQIEYKGKLYCFPHFYTAKGKIMPVYDGTK